MTRTRTPWSELEDSIVISEYPAVGAQRTQHILEVNGYTRKRSSIHQRAYRLGVTKRRGRTARNLLGAFINTRGALGMHLRPTYTPQQRRELDALASTPGLTPHAYDRERARILGETAT